MSHTKSNNSSTTLYKSRLSGEQRHHSNHPKHINKQSKRKQNLSLQNGGGGNKIYSTHLSGVTSWNFFGAQDINMFPTQSKPPS
jgi:hypothetical protein